MLVRLVCEMHAWLTTGLATVPDITEYGSTVAMGSPALYGNFSFHFQLIQSNF